ncbi:MAG: phosphoadenosine phosphosulfate reductase [Pseudomonadota bacterium]
MAETELSWDRKLAEIGAEKGFYEAVGDEHKALFVQGSSTLVVTFDNLDDARQDETGRLPWGSDFAVSNGWSSLGIMAHGWTWFRTQEMDAFFDRLKAEGFFDRFERVVFYGVSMGGFGATAFARAAPGCTVIAMSPQATLDRAITGAWETRFVKGWSRDYSGPYGFGPMGANSADRVFLFHDPLVSEDAGHAALFDGPNIVHVPCRRFGHGLASALARMGILKTLVTGIVDEDIGPTEIFRIMRARRHSRPYQKALLRRLEQSDHPLLTQRFCKAVLAMSKPGSRPHFVNAMRHAEAQIAARSAP